MRHRHAVPDAPCDEEIEPALRATRRALLKGKLRRRWLNGSDGRPWPDGIVLSCEAVEMFDGTRRSSFEDVWEEVCEHSPPLKARSVLRPSDLPRQIAIAKMIVRQLRMPPIRRKTFPDDRLHREGLIGPAVLV